MQVVILDSKAQVGEFSARRIMRRVLGGHLGVLGVATGSSPVPVYEALERLAVGRLAEISVFALDEYVGLDPSHPESYSSVIDREVTQRLRLRPGNVHVPDSSLSRIETAGARYEALIRAAGGIDLQILGIGSTGHIGFNEPSSSLSSRTRIKTLTEQTRRDNARFFAAPDDVPTHCITQGLGTIMDAREVLLVATGAAKAQAVAQAVEGPVSSMCPGSILQMHERATVVLDRDAAAELRLHDYYTYVQENRPSWQD